MKLGLKKNDPFLVEMYDNQVIATNTKELYKLKSKKIIALIQKNGFMAIVIYELFKVSVFLLFLQACSVLVSIDNGPYSLATFLLNPSSLAVIVPGAAIAYICWIMSVKGMNKFKNINHEYESLLREQLVLLKEIYSFQKFENSKNPDSALEAEIKNNKPFNNT